MYFSIITGANSNKNLFKVDNNIGSFLIFIRTVDRYFFNKRPGDINLSWTLNLKLYY